jgi:quinol monooxygenase YgiN
MYVQIVKFKLKPNASRDEFLLLTERMVDWLKIQDGFVAYELYEGDEWWSDRLVWESDADAQDGLAEFLDTELAAHIISKVEPDYSSFFGHVLIQG